MGLVWWLKSRTVTALGPEHAGVGQPTYDRVTLREWVNPYARPVRPVSLSPILEHQQRIMHHIFPKPAPSSSSRSSASVMNAARLSLRRNLPFEEWTSVFGNQRLTGALLDRLTHHVHILELNGESYRLKQSKAPRRCATQPLTKPPRPPIQKPPKSSALPENRVRPSCEILAISAGADAARPALRPRRKLVWFCSAPMAGFYSAVDNRKFRHRFAQASGRCWGKLLWMVSNCAKRSAKRHPPATAGSLTRCG